MAGRDERDGSRGGAARGAARQPALSFVFSGAEAEILRQRAVWHGHYPLFTVEFRHRRFDGAWSDARCWEVWQRGHAIAVLPYDARRDTVVLIEQFRLPAAAAGFRPVLTELCAGFVDPGETPEAAARREAEEETGLTLGRLVPIADLLLTPGGSDERCTLFCAEASLEAQAGAGGGVPGTGEDIRVRQVPAKEAIAMALDGRCDNAIAAIGLLWLAARRTSLREAWAA